LRISEHYRKTIRLKEYDYSYIGAYYVTICLNQRIQKSDRGCVKFGFPTLGRVENRIMIFNEFGNTAYDEWVKLSERYKGVSFDIFQIMPDHVHGIIEIHDVGTTIGRIIGAYKSLVFKKCLEISKQKNHILGKLWQRNYYERIIRNEIEYSEISEYIRDNPNAWNP
jgi:REP element-mobilizing transposase RayT